MHEARLPDFSRRSGLCVRAPAASCAHSRRSSLAGLDEALEVGDAGLHGVDPRLDAVHCDAHLADAVLELEDVLLLCQVLRVVLLGELVHHTFHHELEGAHGDGHVGHLENGVSVEGVVVVLAEEVEVVKVVRAEVEALAVKALVVRIRLRLGGELLLCLLAEVPNQGAVVVGVVEVAMGVELELNLDHSRTRGSGGSGRCN